MQRSDLQSVLRESVSEASSSLFHPQSINNDLETRTSKQETSSFQFFVIVLSFDKSLDVVQKVLLTSFFVIPSKLSSKIMVRTSLFGQTYE